MFRCVRKEERSVRLWSWFWFGIDVANPAGSEVVVCEPRSGTREGTGVMRSERLEVVMVVDVLGVGLFLWWSMIWTFAREICSNVATEPLRDCAL